MEGHTHVIVGLFIEEALYLQIGSSMTTIHQGKLNKHTPYLHVHVFTNYSHP